MARKRRACCEAVAESEPPKGGEASASGGGAKRRAAMRESTKLRIAAGDRSGATELRRRLGTSLAGRTRKQKRAATEGSEGARDRHRNGEDRAAGFVEPGGAKPRPAE